MYLYSFIIFDYIYHILLKLGEFYISLSYTLIRGEKMNFGKLMNLIAQNNINPEDVFMLVDRIKNTNLKDENNLRQIIQEVGRIAGKKIDKQKEDQLVKKILNDGVGEDIFEML